MPAYLFLDDPVWAAVYWATYIVFALETGFISSREKGMARGDMRDRGSRGFIYFMSFFAMGLAFGAPFAAPGLRIALPAAPVFWTAMALFWAGLALYGWAYATLGSFFRTEVQLLEGHRLVTGGPYRVLRHPAYTGGTLVMTGIGLASGNWLSVAGAFAATIIAYARRIAVEEAALGERFGAEFEARKSRTWALLPFFW